jgi:site-specific recombinase XerD
MKTLRLFFKRAIERKWTKEDPTTVVRFPKQAAAKRKEDVKYLTDEQFAAVLENCNGFTEQMPDYNKLRLRALLMVMRYSGLRISDAVVLKSDAIKCDVLYVETKKASTPVQIPLHPELDRVLKQLTPYEGGFFFWNRRTETSKASTVQHNYTSQIREVFRNAGIKGGSRLVSHSLRNTFAVHLLEKGLPLETVSLLLGHKSVTTTEQYYADFSKGFMDGIEARVRSIWNGDTLA